MSKTIHCNRCNKVANFDKGGGVCEQCEHELCPKCADWIGGICKACARMMGVKTEEDYEIAFYPQSVVEQLEDRCRSLFKMSAQNRLNTKKAFSQEIEGERFKKFFIQWRCMNTEPKEWVNEQLRRMHQNTI